MPISRLVLLAMLCAPPLGAQGAGVTLGRGQFNGLKARVAGIRFFESAGGIPAPRDRQVTTKFDALTTRFINLELELVYAKAARRTAFQVECRFEGPGGAARTVTLPGNVEAGWVGSYHAAGVGSPDRGQWAEGIYKVGCREGGQVVASARIEVVKSVAAVRKLGAAVVKLRFYQSLAETLPVEIRRYSTRFDARTAKWIKTEFALVYPQVTAAVNFSVECAYVFPDKSVKRVTVERQIPAGWTGSAHVQGVGWDELGQWPVGKYSVSCWTNGEKMAEGGFEVAQGAVAGQGVGGGRLRFYARKASDSAAAPSYGASFEVGSYDSLYAEASVPVRVAGDSAAFGCLMTDPAGITSAFGLSGELREGDASLLASGPVGLLDAPKQRGMYRVECRTGARAAVAERFELTGKPELLDVDARLVSVALFAGQDQPPGDEAVPDVVFSAGKLQSLWVVAVLDHPGDQGAGQLPYSCRVTNARGVVLASSGAQQVAVAGSDRAIVLRARLVLAPRQRWGVGKHTVQCASGTTTIVREAFDLTR